MIVNAYLFIHVLIEHKRPTSYRGSFSNCARYTCDIYIKSVTHIFTYKTTERLQIMTIMSHWSACGVSCLSPHGTRWPLSPGRVIANHDVSNYRARPQGEHTVRWALRIFNCRQFCRGIIPAYYSISTFAVREWKCSWINLKSYLLICCKIS